MNGIAACPIQMDRSKFCGVGRPFAVSRGSRKEAVNARPFSSAPLFFSATPTVAFLAVFPVFLNE
jgi:hypothetical protein